MSAPSEIDYLFVYGTLRRDAGHAMAKLLAASSTHVGLGWFQGRIYRVSWYPCAIPSDAAADRVVGDVFALQPEASAEILETLDEYEGTKTEGGRPPYYRRERRRVTLEDGRKIEAWIYLFNRPTDRLERIESGDFLAP